MSRKELYWRLKKEHRCTNCRRPLPPNWTRILCEKCDITAKADLSRRWKERKEQGLCVSCGKEPALPGQVRCPDCAEKHNESSKKYYRERDNGRQVAHNKERAQIWKDEGLCWRCGRTLPEGYDGNYCPTCLDVRQGLLPLRVPGYIKHQLKEALNVINQQKHT